MKRRATGITIKAKFRTFCLKGREKAVRNYQKSPYFAERNQKLAVCGKNDAEN
jgi:hypothetical protein